MEPIDEKEYEFLAHLFKDNGLITEFIRHSQIHLEFKRVRLTNSSYRDNTVMYLFVDPEVYAKNQNLVKDIGFSISKKYQEITDTKINELKVLPELSKFQILKNGIVPIITPWEIINSGQNELIQQLRTSTKGIDFQNVGNTSRTLLQKLSNIVFEASKHLAPVGIDLSEGKFKNRLHAFIKVEIGGGQNEELRDYVSSLITTTEKAVDLSNKTTHDLNAYRLMAESCVIGVITVISLIKLIEDHTLTSK